MDIVRNAKAEPKPLKCFNNGDTFLCEDDIYIMTDDFNPGRQICAVVCLRNGVLLHLGYDCEAIPVQCRLVVEG